MANSNVLGGLSEIVKEESGQFGKTVKQQVAGSQSGQSQSQSPAQATPSDLNPSSDAQTKEAVKSFYEKSSPKTQEEQKQQEIIDKAQVQGKTPEEIQKMEALRQQLHKETYYDPTFNRPKAAQEEEKPAEKVEREKKEEEMKLMEDEKKKPPPLAVQREQNKAEMFRGASG